MRGLSTNEGDAEDDAAAAKKFAILCVNTEIFVQASFNSLFQLLIISSRSRGRPSPPLVPPLQLALLNDAAVNVAVVKPPSRTAQLANAQTFSPCIDAVPCDLMTTVLCRRDTSDTSSHEESVLDRSRCTSFPPQAGRGSCRG